MKRIISTLLIIAMMLSVIPGCAVPEALEPIEGDAVHHWNNWVPDPNDETKHIRTCGDDDCNATDTAEHNMILHMDETGHWMECDDCHFKGETESHTWHYDDWEEEGHTQFCKVCEYSTTDGPVPHVMETKWDETGQWTECA